MRKLLALALVLLSTQLVGGWTFPGGEGSGGMVGGGGRDHHPIAWDYNMTNYTGANTQCVQWGSANANTAACANFTTKHVLTQPHVITRFEAYLAAAVVGNVGCTFTLFTNAGEVPGITEPMQGDQNSTGRTRLTAAGDRYGESLALSLAAGDFLQVRLTDEPTGSVGDDGTCTGGSPIMITLSGYTM